MSPLPERSLSLEEAVALAQELAGQGLSPSEAAKEAAGPACAGERSTPP